MLSDDASFLHFEHLLASGDENGEEVSRFLNDIIAGSKGRRRKLRKGTTLCRAQIGYEMREDFGSRIELPDAFPPERMKPLRDSVSVGRVNPKGRPCLYLAIDPGTAIAEMRPWRGAYISLGQFRVLKDCLLMDFSDDKLRSADLIWSDEPPTAVEREESVWGDIAYAFAKPLTRNEELSEYLATQAISERFRQEGYDGVAYRSALGTGKCIALFDLDSADLSACALHEVDAVKSTFQQINNWYCIPKHHQRVADSMGIDVCSPEAARPHHLQITGYSRVEQARNAAASEASPTSDGEV